MQYKYTTLWLNAVRRTSIACLLCLLSVAAWAQDKPTIEKQADGAYYLNGPNYRAHVAANGMLDQLKLDDADFLRGPLLYGNGGWNQLAPTAWKRLKVEQPAPDTLKTTLAVPDVEKGNAVLTLEYGVKSDGLHLIVNRLADSWGGSMAWQTGESVIAIEPLARPGLGWPRLPGNGRIYALPLLKGHETVRDMRYYFANRRVLDVTYRLNDSAYNRQNNGTLVDNRWGRSLFGKGPVEFLFQPAPTSTTDTDTTDTTPLPNAQPRLRALPAALQRPLSFALAPDAPESMTPVNKPAGFQIAFAPAAATPEPLALNWRILDFNDKETLRGTLPVLPLDVKAGTFRFSVTPKNTGWFRLIASLRPASAPDALPGEDEVEFGVFTPTAGLVSPPVSPGSSVGVTGLLGLRCVRNSLYVTQFFPTRKASPVDNPKYDWNALDGQINPFFEECEKFRVTGFCQLNVRPDWADPAAYETLIRLIVTRYKAKVKFWEIENEPQDRYAPDKYVSQCLAPAYRGAHMADTNCVIMGPAIVHISLPWFAAFFKAGGAAACDAISTHTYTGHNRSWEEHGNAETIRALRKLMKENGAENKPLWQTEEGFTFNNHADMPRLHAAYVARMFALAASVGIPAEHCYYFYPVYNGFEPWYLYDRAPNRSGMATRILGEQTAGMHYDRELGLGKYAHGVVYTNGREDVAVLWTNDFTAAARFQIAAAFTLRDIMGVPIAAKPDSKGIVKFTLDGYPRTLRFPHGAKITPLDRFPAGTNYAASLKGGTAEASSYAGAETDAANLNDGTWHYNDGLTEQKIWTGKADAALPQWAAVTFDEPRRIDTIVAVVPSGNVGLPSPRHFQLQVLAGGDWHTVREVKNNTLEWILYAHFPPVVTQAVRVVFLDLNNGWWRDDKTKYTDMAPRVYELEAYGH